MHKYFLFIIFFISTGSFAQKKFDPNADHENFFRAGGKVGLNVNRINGDAYSKGFTYNYMLGGFMQFNFSKRFGIQPEVNFVQASSSFSNDASDVYDDIFYNGSQKKASLDYLKIPVFLNMNVGPSKRVKLQLGPQFGTVLKQTADSNSYAGNLYKKNNWSVAGGIWLQIPFINLGARYELGFTNMNNVDTRQRWTTQAFTLFAGFTF